MQLSTQKETEILPEKKKKKRNKNKNKKPTRRWRGEGGSSTGRKKEEGKKMKIHY
jgi:hypothetical protein